MAFSKGSNQYPQHRSKCDHRGVSINRGHCTKVMSIYGSMHLARHQLVYIPSDVSKEHTGDRMAHLQHSVITAGPNWEQVMKICRWKSFQSISHYNTQAQLFASQCRVTSFTCFLVFLKKTLRHQLHPEHYSAYFFSAAISFNRKAIHVLLKCSGKCSAIYWTSRITKLVPHD